MLSFKKEADAVSVGRDFVSVFTTMEPPAPSVPRRGSAKLGSRLTLFMKQHPSSALGRPEFRTARKDNDRPESAAPLSPGWPTPAIANGRETATHTPLNKLKPASTEAVSDEPLSPDDCHDHHEFQSSLSNSRMNGSSPNGSNALPNGPVSPVFSDVEEPKAKYGIAIPVALAGRQDAQRPSISRQATHHRPPASEGTTPDATNETTDAGTAERSSFDSGFSQETMGTSIHTLPALQTKGPDNGDAQQLEPVLEDDPRSFDLVPPPEKEGLVGMYALEKRSEQLFSHDHLRIVFEDPKLLLKFTGFLNSHRPQSIPLLVYYLDALKALRAIGYANAIAEALSPIRGYAFTETAAKATFNTELEDKANRAFDILVREDLPAYIAHVWIQVVSVSIQRRVTGTLAPHLREASEGLAEVFCLTDPSRIDNPIVFASEEFARTTQYGMSYAIGRNCRFLQGPQTNPNSIRRLAEACRKGVEHTEVFVNYRRDGSPFMNLLMLAPLMDSRGNVRYFIGAQVDVSGLVKECAGFDSLARLVERDEGGDEAAAAGRNKDEFQELCEMFNGAELETSRKYGGRMHREFDDDSDSESGMSHARPRLRLQDPSQEVLDARLRDTENVPSTVKEKLNGKLEGVYQHYLLVRPAPSLRILFTSPSLRVPGILQSPFLHRIGGSARVRQNLASALGEGRGVTAKIRWLPKADEDGEGEGRPRWIHCTPLLGHSGAVGVWMVVFVDEEGSAPSHAGRRFRPAPPVATTIGGREWDGLSSKPAERRVLNAYGRETEHTAGVYAPDKPELALSAAKPLSVDGRRNGYVAYQPQRPALARPSTRGDSADTGEFSFVIRDG